MGGEAGAIDEYREAPRGVWDMCCGVFDIVCFGWRKAQQHCLGMSIIRMKMFQGALMLLLVEAVDMESFEGGMVG